MIRLFATALFISTSLTGVNAAELDFGSSVSKVMVFPGSAQVTRIANGTVPAGDHVIIVDDLPGNVLADSIRVRGMSDGQLVQSSVDVRQLAVQQEARPQERKRIEDAIEALQREQLSIERKLADVDLQRDLLASLASRALTRSGTDTGASLSAEGLTGILDSAANRLATLLAEEAVTRKRQGEIAREMQALQVSLNELAPQNKMQTVVRVNVSAEADANSAFEIEYKVNEAGWRPVYDARLELGQTGDGSRLELVRRASVFQQTGESWNGVELALSTARPNLSTTPPELNSQEIDELRPPVGLQESAVQHRVLRKEGAGGVGILSAPAADAVIAAAPEVVAELAGFQAIFRIPGRNTVENTGETKTVTIDSFKHEADLHALVVPRHDLSAYLMASFTHEGETPLLPGKISLSRDGAFIGSGTLPMLAPGQSHEMGFGVDDQILVTRTETDKEKGESGFISAVSTDRRSWKMTVINQHDFEMPVVLRDRMPVSNREDIRIRLTDQTTTPDARDVDDRRGILQWRQMVSAGETWAIEFGYEVSWPKEMNISSLD